MPEAVIYTRRNCHLCERAHEVVSAVARDYPLSIRTVDVDADAALRGAYGDTVPVIAIDGRVLAAGRVSEYRLRKALGVPPSPRAFAGLARAIIRQFGS